HGRAAARRRRRPAGRPLHRHADEERAGRPPPGDVRPEQRLAGPDRRPGHARRVLRHGDRGLADRLEVRDPGRLPERRVPRDRRRAVADPGGRGPARHLGHELDGEGDVPPVRARPQDPRPEVGDPGHARPRAPHRRPREGRHHRQRQLRPGQPPPDAAAATGEGRPDRRRHPAARGLRARPGRAADPRLGLDVRRDPERGRAAHGRGPERRPRPPPPPEPVPDERREGPPELSQGADPGSQPGPALDADPGPVPDRRRGLQPRPRQAVHDRRDRGPGRADPRSLRMTETTNGQPTLSPENAEVIQLTRKDFVSDQEVRWCPGCGDYSILAQTQKQMPDFGVPKENIVFISGIGCSGRLPYYMNTYGFHTIHGRAPTLATGLKAARPELMVWVITGDGDALSIGGNHILHSMRRNVDITLVMFNNRIYGLTKGQASPTSEFGKKTKSTPAGTVDTPIQPLTVALAAEASFVARSVDTHTEHLQQTLQRAGMHHGSTFVEVLQNCNIFNDGAWRDFTDREVREDRMLVLEHGKPMIFGRDRDKG